MSSRDVLPIPDRQRVGLTTHDAKDSDSSYPPIEPLRPPAGAPNDHLITDEERLSIAMGRQ